MVLCNHVKHTHVFSWWRGSKKDTICKIKDWRTAVPLLPLVRGDQVLEALLVQLVHLDHEVPLPLLLLILPPDSGDNSGNVTVATANLEEQAISSFSLSMFFIGIC